MPFKLTNWLDLTRKPMVKLLYWTHICNYSNEIEWSNETVKIFAIILPRRPRFIILQFGFIGANGWGTWWAMMMISLISSDAFFASPRPTIFCAWSGCVTLRHDNLIWAASIAWKRQQKLRDEFQNQRFVFNINLCYRYAMLLRQLGILMMLFR